PTPVMLLWEPEAQDLHREAVRDINEAEQTLQRTRAGGPERFSAWLRQNPGARPEPARPVAHFSFEAIENGRVPDLLSTNSARLHDDPVPVPGRHGNALKFSGD